MKQILILNYEPCRTCQIRMNGECAYYVPRDRKSVEVECIYRNKKSIEQKFSLDSGKGQD